MVNELNQAIELVRGREIGFVGTAEYRGGLGALARCHFGFELRESQIKPLDAQTRLLQAQMNAQAAEIEIRSLRRNGNIPSVAFRQLAIEFTRYLNRLQIESETLVGIIFSRTTE